MQKISGRTVKLSTGSSPAIAMRKLIVALLATGIVAVAVWLLVQPPTPPRKYSVGPALPPGKVAPQLVNTWDAAILLAPDGTLWAWGGTAFYLRDLLGRSVQSERPIRLDPGSDWVRVASSHMHVLGLKNDGSLWVWGNNGSGQLGLPGKTNRPAPVRLGADQWAQISAGMGHSLGLKRDGSLWAWGQNDHGQVGDGTKSNKFSPTLISSDGDWKLIEAGAFNSFALKTDGSVWGWGLDPHSGTGSGDVLVPELLDSSTNWVAISSGDYCLLALKSDGTLWLRGQNAHITASDYTKASLANFVQIGTDTDWKEVYAGQSYFYARKRDGSWWVCGQNNVSQLGTRKNNGIGSPQRVPENWDPWVMACGYGTTVLLAKDGNLWSWGQRLGTGRAARGKVRLVTERILNLLLRRPIRQASIVIDNEPHWLWELPRDARQSLGTGTPARDQVTGHSK